MIFEKDDCPSYANAAFILLHHSCIVSKLVVESETETLGPVSKEFLRMVEQIKNEKVEQHNLSNLVKAVSENGQHNFAFGVLHCPVGFVEELMRIIALEHNSEPNQFHSKHNVVQKERCIACSNCRAETKEVEIFFSH